MISLALAIHNHQPVGNFEHILEQAYQQAYAPFIDLLGHYPQIKLTLHYSGILWEWFLRVHPEFIAKLRVLVERGQVELMSGGFYEPIMPILPDADKRGQIDKMNRFIKEQFGVYPKGFWLAERVWEPHLVKSLADCGMEYVIVDDSHFQEVGLEGEELYGYYLSEEAGATIKVFPGSMQLRYLIPFHPPEETIQYLHSLQRHGRPLIIQMGDDGEKFGVWPHTYHTAYTERWLERFFNQLIENSSWLKISTYAELVKEFKPLGNVYLPTASYSEMMEWALPTPRRAAFEQAKHTAEHNSACQNCRRFLKGGFWRNFLVKYPESNQMHKKMLHLSQQLQQLNTKDKATLEQAQNELWQGQCNCAYWHGVFGGLYLPHLRKGIYDHLIKCEMLLDQLNHPKEDGWIEAESKDVLLNGSSTALISNSQISLAINTEEGGAIYAWNYKPAGINLANNLTRRPEPYHEKVKQLVGQGQRQEGVQTIHEIQNLKDKDLDKYLSYDNYQRLSLIDHFFPIQTGQQEFWDGRYAELGDFIGQPYTCQISKNSGKGKKGRRIVVDMERSGNVWKDNVNFPLLVKKSVTVEADSSGMEIQYQISNQGQQELEVCFGSEFNIAPAYPDGAYWQTPEGAGSLYDPVSVAVQNEVKLIIGYIRLNLNFSFDQPANLWSMPLYTVSQAEDGYERIYQGQIWLFFWRIKLAGNSRWSVKIQQRFG